MKTKLSRESLHGASRKVNYEKIIAKIILLQMACAALDLSWAENRPFVGWIDVACVILKFSGNKEMLKTVCEFFFSEQNH